MSITAKILASLITLCSVVLATGCGQPYVLRKAHNTDFTPSARIAIIPFDNLTDQDLVSTKVTEYFQTLMANRRSFTVLEAGSTIEALRRHRIRSVALLNEAQIDTLAQELDVQYLISGSVFEYSETENPYLGTVPQVSIGARMIDCRTKQTVWTGVSNDRGDRKEFLFGLGAIRSVDDLARQTVQAFVENIEDLFKK